MISFELEDDDASFLLDQLAIHHDRVENELVHTDKHSMQRELAEDLRRLDALRDALASSLRRGGTYAAPAYVQRSAVR